MSFICVKEGISLALLEPYSQDVQIHVNIHSKIKYRETFMKSGLDNRILARRVWVSTLAFESCGNITDFSAETLAKFINRVQTSRGLHLRFALLNFWYIH